MFHTSGLFLTRYLKRFFPCTLINIWTEFRCTVISLQNVWVLMQIKTSLMESEKLVACDSDWHSLWNNISQARSRKFNSEAVSNSWCVSWVSCALEASLWIKSCKNITGRIYTRPYTRLRNLPASITCSWLWILFIENYFTEITVVANMTLQ